MSHLTFRKIRLMGDCFFYTGHTMHDTQDEFEQSMITLDIDIECRYHLVDRYMADMAIDYDWRFDSASYDRCWGPDDGCTCDSCEDTRGFYAARTSR